MLAVKLSYPFCFSLLNIECVTGVNFLQDGNREVSDVVITLTELLASDLADITVLNVSDVLFNSSPEFPLFFTDKNITSKRSCIDEMLAHCPCKDMFWNNCS